MLASGANVPGCTGAHTPTVACGSLTVTFVSVTLPVFVTTRSYVIGAPTPYGPVDVSLFVTFKAGLWVNVTVSSSVSGPVSLLSAVAVLVKLPASRSACVTPRVAHRHVRQRHVSVVGHHHVVRDRVPLPIRPRRRLTLRHIQGRALGERHRLIVRVRPRLAAVRRRRVGEAPGVQVRLRHPVARRTGHARQRRQRPRLHRTHTPPPSPAGRSPSRSSASRCRCSSPPGRT